MANAYTEKNEKDSRDTAAVYDTPEFLSEVESHRLALRGPLLTTVLAFASGTGFTLFGYGSVPLQHMIFMVCQL